jgi:hypothetical protein
MRFLNHLSSSSHRTERLGERDRHGRGGVRLAPRFVGDHIKANFGGWVAGYAWEFDKGEDGDVFGGTPITAGGTPALPGIAVDQRGRLQTSGKQK